MIPNKAKGTIRTLKNYTKGFSDIQIKAREATSNDPVGPSASLLNELARVTFSHHRFLEVMDIIDKRINDSGKNWRHVFKALTVMEYLLQNGSEEVVAHCKSNLYIIKTLREFQYIDEQSKDQGANVRHKAKDVTLLLTNDEKLKELRSHVKEQLHSNYGNYGNESGFGTGYGFENQNEGFGTSAQDRNTEVSAEDRELAMAIEESRRMAQGQIQRSNSDPDEDLRKAIELSKREAELRENSIAKENELVLLEDYDPTPTPKNPQTNHIKQFDFFGNIVHEPAAPISGGGSSDLLSLDPLHFTGQNTGFQQSSNTSYNSYRPTGYGQPNPFTQTTTSFPQNNNTNFTQNNPNQFGQNTGGFPQNNGGFTQTNTGFPQNNGGFTQTNTGFPQNNSGFTQTNTGFPQNNGGFGQSTGAFGQKSPPAFSQNPPSSFNQQTTTRNYTGLDNAFARNDPTPSSFTSTTQQAAPGFQSQFTGAFDGGFNAKPLPHQNQTNANAALATIARNSSQIDPFASLAAARSNSPRSGLNPDPAPSASNPFHGTWSNAPTNFPGSAPPSQNKPSAMDLFNQPPANNPFASFQGTPANNHPSNENQNIFF